MDYPDNLPGGFHPLIPKSWETCNHPQHRAPQNMVIPYGMFYKHICPGCGKFEYLYSRDIWANWKPPQFNSN